MNRSDYGKLFKIIRGNELFHATAFLAIVNLTNVKQLLILLTIFLVAGCTTNSLVIGYFYGRLDNRMADRILEVATFTDAQSEEITASVDEFFSWHRRGELPRYSDFLEQVESDISTDAIDVERVLSRMETLRGFTRDAFERSPFSGAADFLADLTDAQVAEIEAHFAEQDVEFEEWMTKREKAGGEQQRVDNIVKGIGRFGVKLSDGQRQIIADGIARLDSDPRDRHGLWNAWEARLIELLEQRNQPGFEAAVNAHIDQYQLQMQTHRPQAWSNNRQVVAEMIDTVVRSLDPRQQSVLLNRLAQTRASLDKLSRD